MSNTHSNDCNQLPNTLAPGCVNITLHHPYRRNSCKKARQHEHNVVAIKVGQATFGKNYAAPMLPRERNESPLLALPNNYVHISQSSVYAPTTGKMLKGSTSHPSLPLMWYPGQYQWLSTHANSRSTQRGISLDCNDNVNSRWEKWFSKLMSSLAWLI